ncbi:MAG: hypothetical protein LW860_04835 [Xanthomonadaceae bacterium]|jgi:hypothetical protein|nr:hypothetical protein [Xanthomonadaceae bacterium]
MRHVLPWLFAVASVLPLTAGAAPPPDAIIVNGTPMAGATRDALAQRFGYTPRPGRYWYDVATGAWGLEGHGTAGFMMPGLALGGPLRADASNGRTGVFINGRELADSDVAGLWSLGIPAQRGRWWVDAWGNAGPEGFPATFNVFAVARQAAASRGGGGGGGDSIWRTWGSGDNKGSTWIGSDGSLSHSTTINGKTYDYHIGD